MATPIARIARPAWPFVAGAGLALSAAALVAMPGYFRLTPAPASLAALAPSHITVTEVVTVLMVLTALPALVYLGVAAIVRYRAAPDTMGLICAYMLVLFGVGVVGP